MVWRIEAFLCFNLTENFYHSDYGQEMPVHLKEAFTK